MQIHVDESAVGVGKTYNAIRRAVLFPAKYLFALERRASIDELVASVRTMAGAADAITIAPIRSIGSARGFSVRQEIEALPNRYQNGHVIAVCTHEGLLGSDLTEFAGWHLFIDEVPNVLLMQEVQSKLDISFFETNYTLSDIDGKWAKVSLTAAGRTITGSDLYQDDSHRHLRLFHRRVARSTDSERAVVCNLLRWSDMQNADVKWIWWSLFSPLELAAFATVHCLGNGFMSAVSTKLMKAWEPSIDWLPVSTTGNRQLVQRRVSVRYFSRDRQAAISFFEATKGKRALRAIAAHIAMEAPLDRLIWSSNATAAPALGEHLAASAYLSPRQAGSSRWMHCTHAAMVYAAKPNPNIRSVLAAIGVDDSAWIETNEFEAVLQFVTRTSIRDAHSAEHATVYVFDRDQADYLMRFFDAQQHIHADLEWVDLELDFGREKSGPKLRTLSPKEAEQKAAARRANKAESERNRRAAFRRAKTKNDENGLEL